MAAVATAACGNARGQIPLPDAKPVPRMQIVPEPYDQASIHRDGRQIARYHFGGSLRRPFVYPLAGPAGRSLTRMGHPHDPLGHSHHNSVWISHHDVAGVDFWGDRGNSRGAIVHRRIERYEDGDDHAAIEASGVWQDAAGKPLLEERRRMTAIPLDGGQWMLVIDLQLQPAGNDVTLGKTPFGMIGVRMAKTIGVADGGGMIRNSEGGANEQGVFWKRARWVDYSGPIAPQTNEGVTLMDHPDNPNHPTHFHVRNDGWMGASLTFDAPRTIAKNKPLRLRYALFIHAGVPHAKEIDGQYKSFVQRKVAPWKRR